MKMPDQNEAYKDIDVIDPPMFGGVSALKMKHADLVVARASCMPLLLEKKGVKTTYMHPDRKVVMLGKDPFFYMMFEQMVYKRG